MHSHQGSFNRLNVTAKGNGYENDISPDNQAPGGNGYAASAGYHDAQFRTPASGDWEPSHLYGTTEARYFKVPIDTTNALKFPFSGIQELASGHSPLTRRPHRVALTRIRE